VTTSRNVLADGYAVTRSGGSVRFAPHAHSGPGRSARLAVLAGITFGLVLVGFSSSFGLAATYFFGAFGFAPPTRWDWLWPGGIFFPFILLLFAGVVKLVLNRNVPLVADLSGRVRYGRRELVAPGAARSVRLERFTQRVSPEDGPSYEVKTAYVYIERDEGRFVELPQPYFSNLDGWELGQVLSDELSRAMNVPMSSEPPPADQSAPQRWRRREKGCMGIISLTVGLPLFLIGVRVVLAGLENLDGWQRWAFPAMFVGGGGLFGGIGWGFLGGRIRTYFLLLTILAGLVLAGSVWSGR